MRYRSLGKTGLHVSEIGLGCASFWGREGFDEAEAIALVHAAADHGVTLFDTGSSYSNGNAEPRLGRALSTVKNRHDLIIATKAGSRNGRLGVYYDHSPAWIRQSVETSLRNLKLDAITLLNLHGPQPENLDDELLSLLTRLREEGKVRHFGTNNGNIKTLEHVAALPLFESVMTNYSILQPERGKIIAHVSSRGFGVLAGMAAAGGLLGSRPWLRSYRDAWYKVRALKNHRSELQRAKHLAFLSQQTDRTLGEIVVAWVLQNQNVSSAVFGTTRMQHLLSNLRGSEHPLSEELVRKIGESQVKFGMS